MPANVNLDLVPLIGSWRLLSRAITFTDTKEHVEPFGPNPKGRMIVEAGGRIMFLFMKPDRQPPTNDSDRATLFNGMVAYSGTVRFDGPGQFVTVVDLSSHPAFGGEQLRFFTLDGDRLTIRTPEQPAPVFGGRLAVQDLVWERERAAT